MAAFMGLIIILCFTGLIGSVAHFFKEVIRDCVQICVNIYEDYFKKEGDK